MESLLTPVDLFPELPIVELTGNHDESLGVEAAKFGAQGYIQKGRFPAQVLIRIIEYATERKHLQRSLQNSEAQFRSILDTLESQVLLLDMNHSIIWPNARACKAGGLSRDQMIVKNATTCFMLTELFQLTAHTHHPKLTIFTKRKSRR